MLIAPATRREARRRLIYAPLLSGANHMWKSKSHSDADRGEKWAAGVTGRVATTQAHHDAAECVATQKRHAIRCMDCIDITL